MQRVNKEKIELLCGKRQTKDDFLFHCPMSKAHTYPRAAPGLEVSSTTQRHPDIKHMRCFQKGYTGGFGV
jgi:hypothetical protein